MDNVKLTRRAALVGAALSSAALTAPALAALGGADSAPTVAELIDHHRAAAERLNAACDTLWDAENADRARPASMVPMAVNPATGEGISSFYEFPPMDEADCRKGIAETHAGLRRTHLGKWAQMMAPDYAKELAAQIDASERLAIEALERAIQAHAPSPEFRTAQAIWQEAEAAEVKARCQLLVARPRSEAEAALKAEYLEGSPEVRDGFAEEGFASALLAELGRIIQ